MRLESIAVSPSSATLEIGERRNFEARGTFSDGSTEDLTGLVDWTSSETSVGTIDDQGQFTAVRAGSTNVQASLNAVRGTAAVTVRDIRLESISVSPSSATLDVGERRNFEARGTFSDGSTRDVTGDVNWTSSNESVGTISSSGRFRALSAGQTTVRASLSGQSDTASVTVRAQLESIAVSPSSATLDVGDRRDFEARARFSDGSTRDVMDDVNWTSSNENVGTISNAGRFRALSAGQTTVRAALGGENDTARVTVRESSRPTCREQFGDAPGFVLCAQTETTCRFNARTARSDTEPGTCDEMCERFGSRCLAAFDNEDNNCEPIPGSNDTCSTPRQTEICECARQGR